MTGTTQLKHRAMTALGIVAVALGIISDAWYLAMINQWLLPWDSLQIIYALTMP
jgi:hypothetical protein